MISTTVYRRAARTRYSSRTRARLCYSAFSTRRRTRRCAADDMPRYRLDCCADTFSLLSVTIIWFNISCGQFSPLLPRPVNNTRVAHCAVRGASRPRAIAHKRAYAIVTFFLPAWRHVALDFPAGGATKISAHSVSLYF